MSSGFRKDSYQEASSRLEACGADTRTVNERLVEKVTVTSVIPSDVLDTARHFLERTVRDVKLAAHDFTRDALLRIKSHLLDLLPSFSSTLNSKILDERRKDVNRDNKGHINKGKEEEEVEDKEGAYHRQDQNQPAVSLLVKASSRL